MKGLEAKLAYSDLYDGGIDLFTEEPENLLDGSKLDDHLHLVFPHNRHCSFQEFDVLIERNKVGKLVCLQRQSMTGLLALKHPVLVGLLLSPSKLISLFIRDVPADRTR